MLCVPASHFVDQRGYHSCPCTPQRVPHRDGATVDVHFGLIQAQRLITRNRLSRKGLIEFHQVDGIKGEFVRCMTFWMAGTGPMPISAGATPAAALEPTKASTSIPKDFARSASIKINAAAPSLTPEALPAVTEPEGSLVNAGRSLARARGGRWTRCSSMSTKMVHLCVGAPRPEPTPRQTDHAPGRGPSVLALQSKLVLCLSGDAVFWATVSAVIPNGSVCPISSILGCTNRQPIEAAHLL